MVQTDEPRRRGRRRTGGIGRGTGGKEQPDTRGTAGKEQPGKSPPPPAASFGGSNISSTTPKLSYKPHNTLLIQFTEQTPTWYECGRNTPGRDDTVSSSVQRGQRQQHRNTPALVSRYRSLADEIFEHEVSLARQKGTSGYSEKDEQWVENTMRRGTLKDRIAAMSVVVGGDPVHKLHALDMLLDLAGCSVREGNDRDRRAVATSTPNARVGQMASEALSDLFASTVLPRDRKLVALDARPLHLYEGGGGRNNGGGGGDGHNRTLSPRVLLLWRYEEMVKIRYASYLARYLGRTLSGEDEPSKRRALTTAAFLLKGVPEGEEGLLNVIANKIGDPHRKVASAAGHQLREVLTEHPVMVNVVAREIQQLAHRPHLSSRALYNCIVFLNQLQLSKEEEESEDVTATGEKVKEQYGKRKTSLPASLINTYFRLFEVAVKKGESERPAKGGPSVNSNEVCMKSRLLSALLTGVNRAHPYLPRKDAAMEEHVDALYRIAHTAPPSAATQALMLLFNLAIGSGDLDGDDGDSGGDPADKAKRKGDDGRKDGSTARRDRFYRAMYAKVGDTDMYSGRQLTMFFNLLYKAAKSDTCTSRICAFSKRLLYTALHLSPPVACGALFLLSEIVRCRPELQEGVGISVAGAEFDPKKREPRAAFGDTRATVANGAGDAASYTAQFSTGMWELSLLTHHFHPSVSKFAPGIDGDILYKGDPLKDFSLSPFLDKFAFRNPKSLDRLSKHLKRGESIAEKKSGLDVGMKSVTSLPMNDPSHLKASVVADEEQFFHHFFAERAKRDEMKGVVRGKGDGGDQGADNSDLEDEALKATEVDDEVGSDWDTDPEEEAFANELAEKLMESAGNGKANLDNEDPDMDDWSDSGDDDKEENSQNEEDGDDDEDVEEVDFSEMDGLQTATSSVNQKNEDDFMDAESSDDDDGSNSDGSDGDIGLLAALADDSDDGSSSEENSKPQKQSSQKKKKKPESKEDLYADAEEYENIINEGLKDHKRDRQSEIRGIDKDDAILGAEAAGDESIKGKKRRRRNKHR